MAMEPEKQTERKRFERGGKPGPGRPKGIPNKATIAVKAALEEAFERMGGVDALIEWGKTSKDEFYKIWAKLLPREVLPDPASHPPVNVHVSIDLSKLTDDQLTRYRESLCAIRDLENAAGLEAGAGESGNGKA